jgi:hypothetical protein
MDNKPKFYNSQENKRENYSNNFETKNISKFNQDFNGNLNSNKEGELKKMEFVQKQGNLINLQVTNNKEMESQNIKFFDNNKYSNTSSREQMSKPVEQNSIEKPKIFSSNNYNNNTSFNKQTSVEKPKNIINNNILKEGPPVFSGKIIAKEFVDERELKQKENIEKEKIKQEQIKIQIEQEQILKKQMEQEQIKNQMEGMEINKPVFINSKKLNNYEETIAVTNNQTDNTENSNVLPENFVQIKPEDVSYLL